MLTGVKAMFIIKKKRSEKIKIKRNWNCAKPTLQLSRPLFPSRQSANVCRPGKARNKGTMIGCRKQMRGTVIGIVASLFSQRNLPETRPITVPATHDCTLNDHRLSVAKALSDHLAGFPPRPCVKLTVIGHFEHRKKTFTFEIIIFLILFNAIRYVEFQWVRRWPMTAPSPASSRFPTSASRNLTLRDGNERDRDRKYRTRL